MATLYLYDNLSVDIDSATKTKWNSLYQELRKLGWRSGVGHRQGFVNVIRRNKRIYGYYANEGKKSVLQFDNRQRLVKTPSHYYSFEHIFFIIFEDTAQIVIQSKRISGYIDLTNRIIRSNFLLQLFKIFKQCGFLVVGNMLELMKFSKKIDQGRLKSLFLNMHVVTLEVDSFTQAAIPARDDPKFVLKDSSLRNDEVIWLVISDMIKNGLDRINLFAGNLNSANLRCPFSQALVTTGQIKLIEGYVRGKYISQERRDEVKIEVRLPDSLDIPGSLIDILEQKI